MRRLVLTSLIIVLGISCTTTMKVRPAGPDVAGMRYSLVKPLLMVTPKADGTASYEWIYVPDASAQYAIETKSYMAKHKATITLDESGLLKKVEWNPQSAEIAKALIESSGAVVKAELERRGTEAKAEQTKIEAAETKRQEALAAVRKAESDARLALDLVNAELSVLGNGDAAKVLDAQIRKAQAEVRLAQATRAREELEAQSAASTGGGAGLTSPSPAPAPNPAVAPAPDPAVAPAPDPAVVSAPNPAATTPAVTVNTQAKRPRTPGPIFFEIVEDSKAMTVSLRAVNAQADFETYKKPDPPTPPPAALRLRAVGNGIARLVPDKSRREITIESSSSIHSIIKVELLAGGSGPNPDISAQYLLTSNLTPTNNVVVNLKPNTPKGLYRLIVHLKRTEKADPQQETVPFGVF